MAQCLLCSLCFQFQMFQNWKNLLDKEGLFWTLAQIFYCRKESKHNKRLTLNITKPNHTQNLPSCPIYRIFNTSFVNNPQNQTCLISLKLDPGPMMSYALFAILHTSAPFFNKYYATGPLFCKWVGEVILSRSFCLVIFSYRAYLKR